MLLRRRRRLLQLRQLRLHLVQIPLEHLVRLLVRPLLLPTLRKLALQLCQRFSLLLDAFHPFLHQLDLDGAFLVGLLLCIERSVSELGRMRKRWGKDKRTFVRISRTRSRISSLSLTTFRSASTLIAAVL